MISFRDFFLTEDDTARVGIEHLYSLNDPAKYSMSPEAFEMFVSELDKNGGVISPENSSASEKIDGMALTIGKENGRFYMASSYSGKVFDPKEFLATSKKRAEEGKEKPAKVYKIFADGFNKLQQTLERAANGIDNVEVRAEWLENSLAIDRTERPGFVYFVEVDYDTTKLGKWSTFAIIYVKGQNADQVKEMLVKYSPDDCKFFDPRVEIFPPINLKSSTKKAKDALAAVASSREEIKTTTERKRKSELKKHVQSVLLPIQKEMYDKISKVFASIEGKLGDKEGFILQSGAFKFKVNTPDFMKKKFKLTESLLLEEVLKKADIVFVPGSFKPPHKGHYEMVRAYSEMAKKVVVLISTPSEKNKRFTKSGREITPETAKQIFEEYVSNLPNVEVQISPTPSPVSAVFEAIKDPQYAGTTIALGASKKDDDWKRFANVPKFIEKENLNINLLDPQSTAIDVANKPDGTPYSASFIRDNIDNVKVIQNDLPGHVVKNPTKLKKVLNLLK